MITPLRYKCLRCGDAMEASDCFCDDCEAEIEASKPQHPIPIVCAFVLWFVVIAIACLCADLIWAVITKLNQ